MLSNPTSGIQRRRTQHRRQNSTPLLEVVPDLRPIPAIQRQRSHRRGMSLDQHTTFQGRYHSRTPPSPQGPFPPQDQSVSITNPGQPLQHPLQVAQQHRLAQPGQQHQQQHPQYQPIQPLLQPHSLEQSPVHSPIKAESPSSQPSEQQLKELEHHIQSVCGSYGTVYINILPNPVPAPQKPAMPAREDLDVTPMSAGLDGMAGLTIDNPAMNTNFLYNVEHPESDRGYELSYYSSPAHSPNRSPHRSPSSSPQQRSVHSFAEDVQIAPAPQLSFSEQTSFPPHSQGSTDVDVLLSSPARSPMSPPDMSLGDLSLDATIEDTGISPEVVQSYISEQDMATHRWTCLYPGCDKTFGRRENIRSHVQTHLGDRQFRCIHCSKCFVRQHDLKRHAKIHSGDKPYKCPCGGGFARQDALTRHRQRGMCIGGFPNAVRSQARRGRPRKQRPNMEDRIEKANKSRQAATYASSSSGASQCSDPRSPPSSSNGLDTTQFTTLHDVESSSNPSSDPFSLDSASSPYTASSPAELNSFNTHVGVFDVKSSSEAIFRLAEEAFGQTPPDSPLTRKSAPANNEPICIDPFEITKSPVNSTKSVSSAHAFTTPPTSPPSLFDDFEYTTSQYESAANVQASDFMFCDPNDFVTSSSSIYDANDDAFKAADAWMEGV